MKIPRFNISYNVLKFIGIGLLIFIILQQCQQNSNLKNTISKVENVSNRNFNNYIASQDSLKFQTNQNEDLVANIKSFEYEVNSLTSNNKKLIKKYQNVLNINGDLKNINSLLSASISVKDSLIDIDNKVHITKDTIEVELADLKKYDENNWRQFSGNVRLVNKDSLFVLDYTDFVFNQSITLKAAIEKKNGINILKISTPYKGVSFSNIENIQLVNDKLNNKIKQKSGWSIGVGIGYGINLNNNQVISTGPSIGVGVYWSPSWLRFN